MIVISNPMVKFSTDDMHTVCLGPSRQAIEFCFLFGVLYLFGGGEGEGVIYVLSGGSWILVFSCNFKLS